MRKKALIIILIMLVVLIAIGIVTGYQDNKRVQNNLEPKYVIKTLNYKGNKIVYWGMGYKVVKYINVSPKEPFQSNLGVKYGSWFMQY